MSSLSLPPNESQSLAVSADPRKHDGGLARMLRERRDHDRAIKLCFLDVDGVLNNSRQRDAMSIDPQCIKLFAELVIKTGAYIVMSSTWRKHPAFMDFLIAKFRILNIEDRLVGKTSVIGDFERPKEIALWIRKFEKHHFSVDAWVAIDDMNLEGLDNTVGNVMRGHCVLTTMRDGFTRQSLKQAENTLFNRPERIATGERGNRKKSWTEFLFREVANRS